MSVSSDSPPKTQPKDQEETKLVETSKCQEDIHPPPPPPPHTESSAGDDVDVFKDFDYSASPTPDDLNVQSSPLTEVSDSMNLVHAKQKIYNL